MKTWVRQAAIGRVLIAVSGLVFVGASLWLAILMPRSGFGSSPPGSTWTADELFTALDTQKVSALLPTTDRYGDVVARTIDGNFAVYRAAEVSLDREDVGRIVQRVDADDQGAVLASGRLDAQLITYAATVARVPPPDTTAPVLAWWISLIAGLSTVMYRAAGLTSFRFSVPIGSPLGVGTNRSP